VIRCLQFCAFLGSAAAALALAIQAPPAAGATAPEKSQQCVVCHGPDGLSKLPNAPHIAGQPEIYIVKSLEAYRSGERKDEMMSVIAKPLTDEDIAALAAWYSAIEITATLPK
jgi:cytochrome c553